MRRVWALVLALVVAVALGAGYLLGRHEAPAASPPPPPASTLAAASPEPQAPPLGDPALQAQVTKVIDSMERTGHPPRGVAQGGRRGSAKGIFLNSEGRLPAQPRGYYIETDVWPRNAAGRGPQRLIFGKGGDVYYTPDHYRTFTRVK